MVRVEFDVDEMATIAETLRRQGDHLLEGPISALTRETAAFPAVRQRLARYGIRLGPSIDAVERSRGPAAQMANALSDLGLTLASLRNVLNDIERHAEASAGQLFKDVGATRVQGLQRGILKNPQAIQLARLRSQLDWSLPPDPAQAAGAVRLWLRSEIPNAATRKWVVENSPDVARLLAENVDERDAAVRELRALTVQPGSRPFDHFLSLSPERREWLAIAYPSLIGNLDGAPADMRGAANKINLVAYREKLFDDLSQSQLQGYRVGNRDERSIELRLQAIDWLLGKTAGNHILAFDRPDMLTQMKVVVDEAALQETSPGAATKLMYELARQAGTQQGYSQALLKDLDSLSQSKDPAVARFGRETAYDIRTTGQIDAGKAADLLAKADYPLAIFSAIANAGQRIEAGQKPRPAVINAFGQTGAGVGAGLGANALCVAAGPGAVPCALIGVGAGITAEELYQLAEDSNTYAFTPAPGDAGSAHKVPVAMAGPESDYDPSEYFIPLPPPQSGGPYPALP